MQRETLHADTEPSEKRYKSAGHIVGLRAGSHSPRLQVGSPPVSTTWSCAGAIDCPEAGPLAGLTTAKPRETSARRLIRSTLTSAEALALEARIERQLVWRPQLELRDRRHADGAA